MTGEYSRHLDARVPRFEPPGLPEPAPDPVIYRLCGLLAAVIQAVHDLHFSQVERQSGFPYASFDRWTVLHAHDFQCRHLLDVIDLAQSNLSGVEHYLRRKVVDPESELYWHLNGGLPNQQPALTPAAPVDDDQPQG
ncbi:MAG: hypothetical protein AAF467_27370 [Actinomycetota bacterium]